MMAETAVAHDIVVFGRGSDVDGEGNRTLGELPMLRVDRVASYLAEHADFFAKFGGRVLFSCGWAPGYGQKEAPPSEQLEANLMYVYAENKGLFDAYPQVHFRSQPNSYTTMRDGIYAARCGFFGRPPYAYTAENPLGVVAQKGRDGRPGHMARCTYAAQRGFGIPPAAVLPIVAEGEYSGEGFLTEERLDRIQRKIGLFARTDGSLLAVDGALLALSLIAGRLRGNAILGDLPVPNPSQE
jgi:hypothetical protein